jgi:hypothetical protein
MVIPRVHAFEFNDMAAAPTALRESIVETLSRTLAWGRMLRGLVAPFRAFLAAAGTDDVLDLCAGAGGPAVLLRAELAREGAAPRFTLTDLYPRPDAWAPLVEAAGGGLATVDVPVDATAISDALGGGKVRTVINAFHHFRPELAAAIVRDAVRSSQGLFISEGFLRNPLGFAAFAPAGLAALLANPVLAKRDHLKKALLTWATPIALLAGTWDGVISTLRIYTEGELRQMAADAPGFRWTYGTYAIPFGGRGGYFWGVPEL